jgi:pimeloyl-ACP methyl ester carboxylesterase
MSSEAISYASLAMKNRRNMSGILNKRDCLVIHGALDNHIQKKQFDIEALGKYNFHEIAGAGHMCHIEKSGQVIDILMSYLSS